MFELSRQGAVDILAGREPVNAECADAIEQILRPCIEKGQPRVVFNVQEVPLLDSRGLELLLDLHEQCQRRGGQFQLAGPNALCRDILNATGLDATLQVYDDVTSAVGSFAL